LERDFGHQPAPFQAVDQYDFRIFPARNRTDDGKTDAAPLCIIAFNPEKAVEHTRQKVLGDAGAGIPDFDDDFLS
jgi:hypothetical protein